MDEDEFAPRRPDGQVERATGRSASPAAASYAPAVPRLRRSLPAAPVERRETPRRTVEPWRGRLIDLRR